MSIDGVRGAFEAMKAGKLNATVECNPLLGPQLAQLSGMCMPASRCRNAWWWKRGYSPSDQAAAELPNRKY